MSSNQVEEDISEGMRLEGNTCTLIDWDLGESPADLNAA